MQQELHEMMLKIEAAQKRRANAKKDMNGLKMNEQEVIDLTKKFGNAHNSVVAIFNEGDNGTQMAVNVNTRGSNVINLIKSLVDTVADNTGVSKLEALAHISAEYIKEQMDEK